MAVSTETRPKRGRARKHPDGSTERRFFIPPKTKAGLEAFIAGQLVPPEEGAVCLAALNKFLIDAGFLEEDEHAK